MMMVTEGVMVMIFPSWRRSLVMVRLSAGLRVCRVKVSTYATPPFSPP